MEFDTLRAFNSQITTPPPPPPGGGARALMQQKLEAVAKCRTSLQRQQTSSTEDR